MKILIVEDDVLIAEDIKDMLEQMDYRNVSIVHQLKQATESLERLKPDAMLLDIRLEKETGGIEIGRLLASQGKIPFIYITAQTDLSTIRKVAETRPIAYVTKPIRIPELAAAMNLLQLAVEANLPQQISLKDGTETFIVNKSHISFLTSGKNYSTLHFVNQQPKRLVRMSLDVLMTELNDPRFIRVHRSYLVNRDYIESYNKKEIVVAGESIPVSRNFDFDSLK